MKKSNFLFFFFSVTALMQCRKGSPVQEIKTIFEQAAKVNEQAAMELSEAKDAQVAAGILNRQIDALNDLAEKLSRIDGAPNQMPAEIAAEQLRMKNAWEKSVVLTSTAQSRFGKNSAIDSAMRRKFSMPRYPYPVAANTVSQGPELKAGNIMYVRVSDALNVRGAPDEKAPKTASLKPGEKIVISAVSSSSEMIDGISSKWVQVSNARVKGWVFGGYLSDKPR